MSIGLNMILNDVRPGNCCSLSYGFLSVAAVTEMKLQLKYLCAEQCQEFSSALCEGSGSPPFWCKAAQNLRPSSELEWMRNLCLTKNRKRGRGKEKSDKPYGWVVNWKKFIFQCWSMLMDLTWILKTIIKPKGKLNCGLIKPEQIPVLCSVMSCFHECLWGGRAFPQECYMCPSREPGCWVSTEGSGLLPVFRGRTLFGGCSPDRGQWFSLNQRIASEQKFGWKQVKAGARWKGEENGGGPASP